MKTRIGDRQHPAARLPADENGSRRNIRPPPQRSDCCIDVAQGVIRATHRQVGIADVTEPAILGEAFVIESVGPAAAAALWKGNDPSTFVQKVGKIGIVPCLGEQSRIDAPACRTMVDDRERKGSSSSRLEYDGL